MKVCWFSTGVSSFVACYLAKDVDKVIYTHIKNQHPDSLRFLKDCEKILGRDIEILRSLHFESVDDYNSLEVVGNIHDNPELLEVTE